jgi:hypothetical protein
VFKSGGLPTFLSVKLSSDRPREATDIRISVITLAEFWSRAGAW